MSTFARSRRTRLPRSSASGHLKYAISPVVPGREMGATKALIYADRTARVLVAHAFLRPEATKATHHTSLLLYATGPRGVRGAISSQPCWSNVRFAFGRRR